MADIKKFDNFDKLNENTNEDRFISDDGWNHDELEEIGLTEWLDKVQAVQYEVNNCRRGSYAIDGDTGEDLIMKLQSLREELDDVIDNME